MMRIVYILGLFAVGNLVAFQNRSWRRKWLQTRPLQPCQKAPRVVEKELRLLDSTSYLVETLEAAVHNVTSSIEDGEDSKNIKPYVHSDESRAKISAANKGKTPWNMGRAHSEETRRKIAETTRLNVIRVKMEKAQSLGFATIEEYEKFRKESKKKKTLRKDEGQERIGGLTAEGRRKISESMKKLWQDPDYRAKLTRKNSTVSEETKRKISEKVKSLWNNGTYGERQRRGTYSVPHEVRVKISQSLKEKWCQPEYRDRMTSIIGNRTVQWRAVLSDRIKELWNESTFKEKTVASIRRAFEAKLGEGYSERVKLNQEEKLRRAEERERARKARQDRVQRYEKAKEVVLTGSASTAELREILGDTLWEEERVKRTNGNEPLSDQVLATLLIDSLRPKNRRRSTNNADTGSEGNNSRSKSRKGKGGDEETEWDKYDDDDYIDDFENDLFSEDFANKVEVFDKAGNLIGMFDLNEFEEMKSKGDI